MIDSYEVGQKLTADDFVDGIYFPSAKWDYAEVTDIDDNTVTLHYVDSNMGIEDDQIWTRAEMAEMLGWNISKDDSVFEVIDERADNDAESDSEGIADDILNNSTIDEKIGSYAILNGCKPSLMEVSNGKVSRLYIFSTKSAAMKKLMELTK